MLIYTLAPRGTQGVMLTFKAVTRATEGMVNHFKALMVEDTKAGCCLTAAGSQL